MPSNMCFRTVTFLRGYVGSIYIYIYIGTKKTLSQMADMWDVLGQQSAGLKELEGPPPANKLRRQNAGFFANFFGEDYQETSNVIFKHLRLHIH